MRQSAPLQLKDDGTTMLHFSGLLSQTMKINWNIYHPLIEQTIGTQASLTQLKRLSGFQISNLTDVPIQSHSFNLHFRSNPRSNFFLARASEFFPKYTLNRFCTWLLQSMLKVSKTLSPFRLSLDCLVVI